MFESLVSGAFAFNQVLLLLVALFCLGFGGLMLGHEIYWRLRALRVTGAIVGVREKRPMMFYSVYRFILPSGQSVEATSNTGSNSSSGRETGRQVELLVFPEHPEEVSEANSAVSAIFGVVLFLGGLWSLHAALTKWPVNIFTLLMLAAGVVYIARRVRRHLIPKEQRKTPVECRQDRRERHRAELTAIPVRRIEEILASPQAVERQRRDRKSFRTLAPLLALIGIAMILFGVHLGRDVAELEASGHRLQGSVVGLHRSRSGSTYHSVVRFVADNGASIEFEDKVGANPPSHRVGDTVTVLYRDAADDAIIDRGNWNWLPPIAVGLFGCLLLFVSTRMFTAARVASAAGEN